MKKNERIIDISDKYDGSRESKASLIFLLNVTHINMRNFVMQGKKLKKYLCDKLNEKLDEFNGDINRLVEYYNQELKNEVYENVLNLETDLFNVLSSFYALKDYITYDKEEKKLYKEARGELLEFNNILNGKLQAKIIYNKSSISINKFLKDCRDASIHKGAIIGHLDLLPNNDNTKSVPALAIPLASVWNDKYIRKIHLSTDYGLDAIEVFEFVFSCFDQLWEILDELAKL